MKIQMTVLVMLVAATAAAAPLGTEFTYQGVLADAGTPAAGLFDFRFLLYRAPVGGTQVGSIVYVEDLAVTEGRFTTQLDFGAVFDGTALWLEVSVRDGGLTGTYTVLSPRQELTAAPFAQYSQSAGTAVSATTADHATSADSAMLAGNADALDGQIGAYYLTWSNLIGVPAGLDDGDDDTLGDLTCSSDEITRWNGTAWSCTADDDTPYVRTYVVGPVGTPIENGLALDVAMGDIPVPASEEEAVLLILEPGVYELSTSIAPSPWMTIEGAGRELTRITSEVCSVGVYQGTILFWPTSEYAGLRNLTVENTCADSGARSIAVSNQSDYLRIEDVALAATGSAEYTHALFNSGSDVAMSGGRLHAENASDTNMGLLNRGDGVNLFDVTIDAIGGGHSTGIDNDGTELTFRHGRIKAYWGTNSCTGIYVHTDANNLRVEDSRVSATAGTASEKVGVFINGADAKLISTEVGGLVGIQLQNWSTEFATLQLFDVYSSATETGLWVRDVYDNGCQVMVDDGRYNAGTDAVFNFSDSCDVRIGGAYLASGVTGAALCAGVYDYGHTFYVNTCPP